MFGKQILTRPTRPHNLLGATQYMLVGNNGILQGVLDSMQEMLRVLDQEKNIILINESYLACFGDQVGKRCYEMYAGAKPCKVCIRDICVATGETRQCSRRIRGRQYCMSVSALYNADGEAIGTVEVFRDTTQACRHEARLREENKRLTREAKLAARLQRELFLSQGHPDSRVQMCSRYLPASSIGGDMFGCLQQEDGSFCFYVADVSGHGIPAAMITLFLANIFRARGFSSAVEMLVYAKEAFLSMAQDEQLYVSMFTAILNPDTGALTWANAGLSVEPLLVIGSDIVRLYDPALPICNWEKDIVYKEQVIHMPVNARLLLYTDGLLDRRSSSLTEAQLEKRMLSMEGESLLNSLERKVKNNRGDDVCMLLVTRKLGNR